MRRAIAIAVAVVACAGAARGFSGGTSGFSGSGMASCNDCHKGGKPPTVSISGPSTLSPGDTGSFVITITSASPKTQRYAGVDVSTTAGTLQVHPAQNGTRLDNGEIVQRATAGPFDPLDFHFDLIAPAQLGVVELFGDGLSADGSHDESGDAATTATYVVTVIPPPDFAGQVLDLGEAPLDALSSATPAPDLATTGALRAAEPRWGCGCAVGAPLRGARSAAVALAGALIAAAIRRGRRRARDLRAAPRRAA